MVMPNLRAYGRTRSLSDDTDRNGQEAALTVDALALMDGPFSSVADRPSLGTCLGAGDDGSESVGHPELSNRVDANRTP